MVIADTSLFWPNGLTIDYAMQKPSYICMTGHHYTYFFSFCRTLYWTDWGSVPKIERANMDGSVPNGHCRHQSLLAEWLDH